MKSIHKENSFFSILRHASLISFKMMEKRESESLDVPRLSGSSERSERSQSSGTGTEDFSERFEAPKNAIAKKEEKLIDKFRVLIFVLLVLAVVAVGTGAFLFLSEQEQTEFENEARCPVK